MNKQKYLKQILNLENKAKIKNLKAHLNECNFNIRIDSFQDFYDHFDVDELSIRDLNPELETYLINKIDKIDYLPNLKIHVHCSKDFDLSDELIKKACINHFEELSIYQFHENQVLLNKWILRLIGGTFFLGICLFVSNLLHYPQFDSKPFCKVLSEGFSIIGWVAIWEPAYYLLYHRKQDKRVLRNCYLLHSADYIIHRD